VFIFQGLLRGIRAAMTTHGAFGVPVPSHFFAGVEDANELEKMIAIVNSAHNGRMMFPVNEAEVHAEIKLEPELLNSFCRRGRRRLRDIQANCQVNVRLDKLRSVLHISGSEARVNLAKRHISGLGGPRKNVTTAVWAELLRTRTMQSGPDAVVARIQQESGCRIHIERSCQEVRLFGHQEAVVIAERLLEELDRKCVEKVVRLDGRSITSPALQAVAHLCGVTLRSEEGQLIAFGLRDSVDKAVESLDRHLNDPDYRLELPSPKQPSEANEGSSTTATTPSDDGMGVGKVGNVAGNACPTCGACPFCAVCGHPTVFAHCAPAKNNGESWNVDAHNYTEMLLSLQVPVNQKFDNIQPPGTHWIGQQTPFIAHDGSMPQIAVGGTVQGVVPTAFMIPANMVQYGGIQQGGRGQQQPHSRQQQAAPAPQYYMAPPNMMPGCSIPGQGNQLPSNFCMQSIGG
jgi:hypothetical protein